MLYNFKLRFLFLILIFAQKLSAQDVVISGYFNAADVRDEWTEILVVGDNVDMRSWTLRDNNSTQTSWQPEITFLNIPFWSALRSGTVIMLYHRVINSASVTYMQDTDPSDGYIQLNLQNTNYFSGGAFGTSPSWSGNSMNIAAGGEVIQIRNASATHVHALGHCATAGSSWTALPSPKLNHKNSINSGDAVFVCPGSSVAEYGVNAPQDGTTWTTKNNINITFGLPNICGGSSAANSNFWVSLREPSISSQTISSSTSNTFPIVALTFTWNSATDPVSSDQTTGYMILRSTNGVFGTPQDGTVYMIGSTISGGGQVVDYIDNTNAATHSYTDYTANDNGTYCYRVYTCRYGSDNTNGNSFDPSRGRAYNTSSFVEVVCAANPLPIELATFTTTPLDNLVEIRWTTLSEINNAYFTVERSVNGLNWEEVKIVNSYGNSTTTQHYQTKDESPLDGLTYYRLKQTDFDGSYSYSGIVVVDREKTSRTIIKVVDIFGMETYDNAGGLIFKVYEDGSTEKIFRVNQ